MDADVLLRRRNLSAYLRGAVDRVDEFESEFDGILKAIS